VRGELLEALVALASTGGTAETILAAGATAGHTLVARSLGENVSFGAGTVARRDAGAVHAGGTAHRVAARGEGAVLVGIALLAVALLGVQAAAVGTAARADRVADPRLAQTLLVAGIAAALVGRHTLAVVADILANGLTFVQLVIPLEAVVALALSRLQAATVGTVLLAKRLTFLLGAIVEPVARKALTLVRSHAVSVYAGLTALRLTVTTIPAVRVALVTQTHVGRQALSRDSAILALRHTLT